MAERRKIALMAIKAPGVGSVLSAPPILEASSHTVDYTCGRCGTILMHAELDQVHNLLIHCTQCGTYNSTDVEG
jgi:DNA-directed RNA polymerase subunit RPC12/RpoP